MQYEAFELVGEYPRHSFKLRVFPTLEELNEWKASKSAPLPLDDNWMRVAPGTDAAIWRPWSRETGEL